jgi:hypothetical protein
MMAQLCLNSDTLTNLSITLNFFNDNVAQEKILFTLESHYVDRVVINVKSFAISLIELHTSGVYSQIIKWSTVLGCSRKSTTSKTNMMRWAQDKHSSPIHINSNVIIRTTVVAYVQSLKNYTHTTTGLT